MESCLFRCFVRAVPLPPAEWRRKLDQVSGQFGQPVDNQARDGGQDGHAAGRRTLLLDVRNGYEWDVGHFQGAERPDVECFRETEFGLAEGEVPQVSTRSDVGNCHNEVPCPVEAQRKLQYCPCKGRISRLCCPVE